MPSEYVRFVMTDVPKCLIIFPWWHIRVNLRGWCDFECSDVGILQHSYGYA